MPRTKPRPLTPMALRHLKLPATGQVEITDGGCVGLRLRCSTTTAWWVWGGRDSAGHARRFRLGIWPTMGLAQAREAAQQLRVEVRLTGRDPIAEGRQRRREAQRAATVDEGVVTLIDLVNTYGAAEGASQRSWARNRQLLLHVFRTKLTRAASEITSAELQLAIGLHPSITSAGAAARYLKPILKWGRSAAWSPQVSVWRSNSREVRSAPAIACCRATRSCPSSAQRRMLPVMARHCVGCSGQDAG